MTPDNKFGLLRRLLRTIGLSQQSADDVVNFIVDLLAGDSKSSTPNPDFPYKLRDNFLSPAELAFFTVLQTAVNGRAALCTKVSLGDVFWVSKDDPSRYRIYTNKIDRKHVDFLLCDLVTMRPLVGIELDDKSHQRKDRQERDAFVDSVYKAAGLPLLHIPVKRSYEVAELAAQISPFIQRSVQPVQSSKPVVVATPAPAKTAKPAVETPLCPKCGSAMILRTAKSGANAGNRFWGCSGYPTCKSMQPYTG